MEGVFAAEDAYKARVDEVRDFTQRTFTNLDASDRFEDPDVTDSWGRQAFGGLWELAQSNPDFRDLLASTTLLEVGVDPDAAGSTMLSALLPEYGIPDEAVGPLTDILDGDAEANVSEDDIRIAFDKSVLEPLQKEMRTGFASIEEAIASLRAKPLNATPSNQDILSRRVENSQASRDGIKALIDLTVLGLDRFTDMTDA
jgi:hypothetical protein